MTARADYHCHNCGRTTELPIKIPTIPGIPLAPSRTWQCRTCGLPLARVWTTVAIGKVAGAGGSPSR